MVSYRFILALVFFLIAATGGCSAIVSPDDGLLGGETLSDSGTRTDTGTPIRLMDSGAPDGDAGSPPPPPRDGAMPDVSMLCSGGDPRCVGNVQVTCVDGMEERVDCAADGDYCDATAGSCEDQVCVPDVAECDGDRLLVCNHLGSDETRTDCPFGCSAGACSPAPVACAGVPPLASGAMVRVDTCGAGDDETYRRTGAGGGCNSDQRANGPDLVYAITVTTRQRVAIDLRDADGDVAIDTIVYLRNVCDDRSTQLACSDDLPCDETVFGCPSGRPIEVRQSRIITTLDPGTYYVVIDSFNYRTSSGASYTCGEVILSFGAEPAFLP